MAAQLNTAALNRISFFHNIVIENARITSADFSPLNPEPGHLYAAAGHLSFTGYPARFVIGLIAAGLQNELEKPSHRLESGILVFFAQPGNRRVL